MNKLTASIFSVVLLSGSMAHSAIYTVTNLIDGGVTGVDTLFQNAGADASASLLDGGIIALGYFGAGVIPSSSLGDISSTIRSFTLVASALTGGTSAQLGGDLPAGYVDQEGVSSQTLIIGNDPLIGRALYVFAGNAATLEASSAFGLVQVATIASDEPLEQTYLASVAGTSPLIGQINPDAFTGDPLGFGTASFDTFQLTAVPEPSALLLSAFGALALLRRKR